MPRAPRPRPIDVSASLLLHTYTQHFLSQLNVDFDTSLLTPSIIGKLRFRILLICTYNHLISSLIQQPVSRKDGRWRSNGRFDVYSVCMCSGCSGALLPSRYTYFEVCGTLRQEMLSVGDSFPLREIIQGDARL